MKPGPAGEAGKAEPAAELWSLIEAYAASRVDADRNRGVVSEQYLKLARSNLRDALAARGAKPMEDLRRAWAVFKRDVLPKTMKAKDADLFGHVDDLIVRPPRPPSPLVAEDDLRALPRYVMNPENGHMVQSQRGSWTRFEDVRNVVSVVARTRALGEASVARTIVSSKPALVVSEPVPGAPESLQGSAASQDELDEWLTSQRSTGERAS